MTVKKYVATKNIHGSAIKVLIGRILLRPCYTAYYNAAFDWNLF